MLFFCDQLICFGLAMRKYCISPFNTITQWSINCFFQIIIIIWIPFLYGFNQRSFFLSCCLDMFCVMFLVRVSICFTVINTGIALCKYVSIVCVHLTGYNIQGIIPIFINRYLINSNHFSKETFNINISIVLMLFKYVEYLIFNFVFLRKKVDFQTV